MISGKRPAASVESSPPAAAPAPDDVDSESSAARSEPDEKPSIDELARPLGVRSLPLTGLFLIATFFTLYVAQSLFLPLFFALVIRFLIDPLVDRIEAWGLPRSAAAVAVLLLALVGMSTIAYTVARPASVWLERLPDSMQVVRQELADVRSRVERITQEISQATDEVRQMADVDREKAVVVELKEPVLENLVFSQTPDVFAKAGVAIVFLFFLLSAGDDLLRKLVEVAPRWEDKKQIVATIRQIETDISCYLFTITAVNLAFGLVVALMMALLGIPNAALWGVVAAALKFFPYFGTAAGFVLFFLVGILEHQALEMALIPSGLFVFLSLLESFIVTPRILSARITLSPTAIFLSLVFWSWLWGIAGAILSVPLLTTFKITSDRIPALQPVGRLLGTSRVRGGRT